MRHFLPIAPIAFALLTAACATPGQPLPAASPRIQTPADAARPCSLFVLPPEPTQADLEIGYATRGAQLVACDAARELAVRTHEDEHGLEDRALAAREKRHRPAWQFWR